MNATEAQGPAAHKRKLYNYSKFKTVFRLPVLDI